MASLKRGDVVLVQFPFTDLTTVKVRPALIVSADPQGIDVTLAFISSVLPLAEGPFDIVLKPEHKDFGPTGLNRPSVFRMSKLATLESSKIRRRLGEASPALLSKLNAKLAHALGLKK